jgi:hypothetical protein
VGRWGEEEGSHRGGEGRQRMQGRPHRHGDRDWARNRFDLWKAAARSAISTWADHRTITTSQHRSAISTWAVHRTITTAGGSPASQRARLLLWLVSSSAPRLRRSSPSPTATAGSLSRPTDAVSGESICETPAPRTPCRPPRRRWPSLSRLQPLHMNFKYWSVLYLYRGLTEFSEIKRLKLLCH